VSSLQPISTEKYTWASEKMAWDRSQAISLSSENKGVSLFIQENIQSPEFRFIIVLGFMPPLTPPMKTHWVTRERVRGGFELLQRYPQSAVMMSGGNVKPKGTPFNEALEMKKFLIQRYSVDPERVAIDPYSQNTVTNLRNCGRFMLSHNITEAIVTTTWVQNAYVGFSSWSSFRMRMYRMLGYSIGELKFLGPRHCLYHPSQKVFERGPSVIDP
jgi:hypothetical protein